MYNQAFNRRGMFGRGPGPFAPPELASPQLLGDVPKMPMPDPSMGMGQAQPQMGMAPPQRQGGGLRRAAGIFSDFLSGLNGGQANFAISQERAMQQQQEAQQQLAAREDERRYQASEWDRRQGVQAASREPDVFEDNSGNRWRMGPDGQPQLVFYDPTPRYDSNVTFNDRGEQVLVRTPRPNGFNPDGTPIRPASPAAPTNGLPQGYRVRPRNSGGGQPTGARPFDGNRLDRVTMQAESGGRRYGSGGQLLRSPAGAMGEMQVMPETARDPGFGIRPWDGRSPDDLARVGREYRRAMEQRYGGDLAMMWAAYNAGPGRVDEARRRYGDNWLRAMPAETQAYVRRNMRAVGTR